MCIIQKTLKACDRLLLKKYFRISIFFSIVRHASTQPDPLVHSTKLVPSGTSKFSSLENILKEKLDKSVNEETKEIRGIASEARKIIGLSPISKEDVERVCRISGAPDQDSAYLEAVNEYFKLELRMSQEHWFQYSEQPSDTKFDPANCTTRRYNNSPLPYLTKLINELNMCILV